MRRRTQLSGSVIAVAAVAAVAAATLAAPGTAAESAGSTPASGSDQSTQISATLITGDHVTVTLGPDKQHTVNFEPSAEGSGAATYWHYAIDDEVYVIPSDAAPLIPDVLDPELFNVTKLADAGYSAATPVIVQYAPGPRALASTGLTTTATLPSIDAVAATVEHDGEWWESMTDGAAAPTMAAARSVGGVEKVWLDEPVQVNLADSVPQIGAPQAWQSGFDGSDVTVAVLDTGIDEDHPDLTGTVAMAENFTDEAGATDGYGHGTHVASTIAGSGAASDGANTGVAPGATLLNGKVLDNAGDGQTSWVLQGMEWAAANADVVNMSLGAGATDGTDPISQALNTLTAQHGTLFVVSAGNSGPSERTVGTPGSADAALTVGAVDKSDQLAGFSSRGPRRGDWAIKPDVTAPGVNIVAARAAGTALCLDTCVQPGDGPVDADYTSASGTSMAAPHVAGAAAIVLHNQPDLTPAQVKAALVTTAKPHDALTVYQQGGGRVDVPSALTTPVLTDRATLDLGFFEYPHDDAGPVQTEVDYTNHEDEAVTLDLSVSAGQVHGPPVPDGSLTVEPATLEIAPGRTATATVTLDVPTIDIALYSGALRAEQDGELVSRIPVGFHKEDEMYDVTINGFNRAGEPAYGSMSVMNVDDMTKLFRPAVPFINGQALVRVPPGTYSILGGIADYDAHGQFTQAISLVGDPEVTVTDDTALTFDARDANPIDVETPAHETRPIGGVAFGYWRTAETPGPLFSTVWGSRNTDPTAYYAMATDPVTTGGFEYHSRWRLAAPEAELSIVEPDAEPLDPYLLRAPAVDGEQVVPLVDAGMGGEADFAGIDATGAAVLVRRNSDPLFYLEQERLAAQAGAVALIIANDVPGHITGTFQNAGDIPVLSVTQADGKRLIDQLAAVDVTVRLDGTVWSDYLYDLVLVEPDAIPADLRYSFSPDDLTTLEMSYHNDHDGHLMNASRSWLRPYHAGSNIIHPPIDGPRTRTEYVVGGDMIAYRSTFYGATPFEAELRGPEYVYYESGESYELHGYQQVIRPALLPGVDPTTRTGDTLDLQLFEWADAAGYHFPNYVFGITPFPGDTVRTRIWRGDELVGEIPDGFPRGRFPMTPEEAEYRVKLDVTRDAEWWTRSVSTSTEWTFTSKRPDSGTELLPMLSIDYGAELDLENTAPSPSDRRGPSTVKLDIHHQDDTRPAVDDARVWVSYDDGDSWRPAPVRRIGDGQFRAILGSAPAHSDAVSLRVRASDVQGNSIDQTIIRAWHSPERNGRGAAH